MSTKSFRLKYLGKSLAGVPRDLAQTAVATVKAIRPTVLIFNCTWVCDAKCTMCNNWKWGNRKEDLTLPEIDRIFSDSEFWGAIENLNISGGEPTTRLDLPEMVELFHRRLPRMRKIGINTTGLTPARAIPMLTKIVEFCGQQNLLLSIRVSLDGIGDIHNQVRNVKNGFDKAFKTIDAMQKLAESSPHFQFGLASTIFGTNLDDAKNIREWAKERNLDIVFNMLRFTDNMLHNRDLEKKIGFGSREEEFMHQFFLDRVAEESILSGQSFMYLHYADMIANGYHRTMPCPFQRQGLLLNPNGDLFYCENSKKIGNALETPARELYFAEANLDGREALKRDTCPTCLSPCQVNVGAMKQVVPYVKFLRRAYKVKRDPARHVETMPAVET